jgi:acetolactate synthase I/II/III large subunit
MNGAESLVGTLIAGGIDVCFANPGTSEMHIVAAMSTTPGIKPVPCLFEGVASGCADGYARMTGKPAMTLLHCGPGQAYAGANLHNARRARSPVVNIIGDQASYHRQFDPPLASDIVGLSAPVSDWVRTAQSATDLGADAAAAVEAATAPPGAVATLIVPADTGWNKGGRVMVPALPSLRARVDDETIRNIAAVLRSGDRALLLLTGQALRAAALAAAHGVSTATGAMLIAEHTNGRFERGQGRHTVMRMPWAITQARAAVAGIRNLILVGAQVPVAFFAHPNQPTHVMEDGCATHVLANADEDLADALERLAAFLGAAPVAPPLHAIPHSPEGAVTPENVALMIAATMPEHAVVVDESVSFGRSFFTYAKAAPPHDWLHQTGGAIGAGLPLATGAAFGAPGRRVVNLQADGSAMYTIQALWTQAREQLNVTTVILANRKYAVLLSELSSMGVTGGSAAEAMLDIANPDLDFVQIAGAMGVDGARADTLTRFEDLLRNSFRRQGPFVIELLI